MKALTQAWRLGLPAVVALALFLPSAKAQTVYGSMAGTVSDPTGAVIPNAKIQAKNEKTGTVSNTVSTSAGSYRFPELPIGTYDLTVTAPGFQTDALTGIKVDLQVTTGQNITMQVGGTTQTVTINASAIHLQTETSDVTGSITDQDYLKLPLALGGVGAFRSPEAFIFLLPGNTGPGTTNSGNGIFFSKIAGGQDYGAEVLIDGISQQRSENGSSFDEEAPSVDALRELTVTDAVPPAEYNRTTGGIENFATKSGGNSYHGSAYELFRNTALDANAWFNGGTEVLSCAGPNDTAACRARFATPVDRKNDYGGTFSGPVWIPHVYNGHDKLFFFFAWEQLKYSQGGVTTRTIPTKQELSGDFSNPAIFPGTPTGAINPCDSTPILKGQIFDPSTTRVVNGVECRTAFPGNKIPAGDFSKVAQNLLSYFPAPTNDGVFDNFTFSSSSPIQNTTSTIRIDASITDKSKIWSSYSDRDNNRLSGAPPVLPYPIDNATWKQDFETHFWRLGWDYSFSPTLLNHLIIGTNRSNSINFAEPALAGKNWFSILGIGNAVSKNFPVVTNGFTTQEGMPNNGDNVDNGLHLVEGIEWQKGAHSLNIGTDIRYQQYSPINNNSPSINFCNAQTAVDPSQTAQTGNGLASELLGDTCGGSQNVYVHQSRWISWYYSGYVQDNWKVNKDLTLNLGVNYSVDVPRHEAGNFTSNFSPTAVDPEYGVPGALVFGTNCNGCNTKWANTYYKDIGPRLGFAYSPSWLNGKTVLRGGAGIMYGPLQYEDFGGGMNTGYKSNPNFPSKNGFDPSFQIDSGYPAFKPPPNLDAGVYNGSFVPGSYIEKNAAHPAKVYDYDLQVQQQLSNEMILSIGFVGSEAQNLASNNQNINNMPLQDIALGDELTSPLKGNPYGVPVPFAGYFTLWGNGVQIQQALRPFPQYDFIDSGCCLQDQGHSSYDAMLVSLTRQMSNGLSLQASYTWQKNENDTDSIINVNPGQPQVQNPSNLKQEKAISIQDIPQTFVVSYIYELPFGHNKKFLNTGPLSYIAGGWQIGGIQRYQSGVPIAFCCSSGIPGWQQAIRYDELPGTNIRSKVYRSGWKNLNPFAGGLGAPSDPNTNSFFNGAVDNNAPAYKNGTAQPAFVDQNLSQHRGTGAFHLGDTPRVTNIRMPSYFDEDFSLLKDMPIHENWMFELKVEALNAFNRHHFVTPNTNPGSTRFGIPTNTFGPSDTNGGARVLQVTGRIQF